jgi:hypothetical protein
MRERERERERERDSNPVYNKNPTSVSKFLSKRYKQGNMSFTYLQHLKPIFQISGTHTKN